MRLNLARTLARSAANGPGERFVLWVQGCPLACPGCWNPDTWPRGRRDERTVDALEQDIMAVEGLEGVTYTGGEPFVQALALAALASRVRARGLSVVVFTGFDLEELRSPAARSLLAVTDVLVAGRYIAALRTTELALRGSTNQRIHLLTDRYQESMLTASTTCEVHIQGDGTVVLTGLPLANSSAHVQAEDIETCPLAMLGGEG
jgi:anaerobic ribonucleoside-triphosphate reductase activating protein